MAPENKEYLDLKAILIMLALTMLWGFHYTAVKYSNQGLAPVFTSALRSIIASLCGVIYCVRQKERLFHTDIMLFHGFMVGLLFGLEFACIYVGLIYTGCNALDPLRQYKPLYCCHWRPFLPER